MKQAFKAFAFASLCAISTIYAAEPLTVWIMPNGASPQEKLEQRLNEYTQKTGIPTQVQVLDWGEAWNRISTTLASGKDAPDVLQLGTTWIPYFASRGEIKPLNKWLDKIDSTRFEPVSWNTTRIDSDSIVYSIPWFIDVRPVLGNKRILKKNGISKESLVSYKGFIDAIKKINASKDALEDGTKIHAYAFPGKSDWNIPHNFAPWIWSNGGDFITKDENGKWHANILSEKTLVGIAKYLNFVLDSLVAPEALQTNTAQVAQRFNAGELAFIVNTAEIVMQTRFDATQGGLSNAKIGLDSIVVLPIPSGESGSISFIGGSNLAIPATNNRPEALDLLLFLTNDENLDAYTKQIGFLPTSKKVLANWAEDEEYKELVKALETGKTYSAIPEWGDIEQKLVSMFSAVWDHLEIPALYSENKLYQIFKDYTTEIDNILGYSFTKTVTFAEFQDIWHKTLNKQDAVADANKDEVQYDPIKSNLRKAPWVFAIMILLGFAFSFKRKKK
ncbi:MAG: extracellular solute-binding protein [Fibrobacter sp.]|uniref:extracellular solute-binding protein n=1 Tax=Fibrobacter sp. TaxID=35828 RepID=UPI00388FAD59|nr:extracellular solute-binding protein [Fibrobacter sp.]